MAKVSHFAVSRSSLDSLRYSATCQYLPEQGESCRVGRARYPIFARARAGQLIMETRQAA
jgi:hypothetical protein